MMKKWVALMLAVAMLLCATGCGDPTETEETNDQPLTLEQFLESFGMQEQAGNKGPSFELKYTLGNNDGLNKFVKDISNKTPTSYEMKVSEEGYECVVTVIYNGPTDVSIEKKETVNGVTFTDTYENVKLNLDCMYKYYMTEDGQIDSNSYLMALYQAGLYGWYATNPTIFVNCVCYLTATLSTGETVLLDYYYNEELAAELEEKQAAQATK